MKILVPIKRVIDPSFRVRLKPDHSGLDMAYMKMVMNPYDEVALEAALQLREQGVATQIMTVSCGTDDCVETLRTTLAMGADETLFVEAPYAMSPLVVARLLKAVAVREGCGLVLIGRQGMGNDGNQVGPMLAALLGWPCLPFAETLTIGEGKVRARCKADHGFDVLETVLPAVVSVEIGLNVPRRASLPSLVKAKKRKIPGMAAETLGVDMETDVIVTQLRPSSGRHRGLLLPDAATLVSRLRTDTRII